MLLASTPEHESRFALLRGETRRGGGSRPYRGDGDHCGVADQLLELEAYQGGRRRGGSDGGAAPLHNRRWDKSIPVER